MKMLEIIENVAWIIIILTGILVIIARSRGDLKVAYVACLIDIVAHAIIAGVFMATGKILMAVLYMILGFMWVDNLRNLKRAIQDRDSEE